MIDLFFVIIVIFSLYTIWISYKKFGFITNHYALYNVYWVVSLLIAKYYNNFLTPVRNSIFYIFLIGLFFFNVTLFFSKIAPFSKLYTPTNCYYSLGRRRLIELIVLCALVPLAYANIKRIMSGEAMWMINHDFWDSRDEGSYFERFYRQNIVSPLSTLLMTTCFFCKYKNRGKFTPYINILIGVCLAFLSMFVSGGGRTGLITLIFVMVLSSMGGRLFPNNDVFYKVNLKYTIIFVIIAFIGVGFASVARGDENPLLMILSDRMALFAAEFEGYYYGTDLCDGYALGLGMFETPLAIISMPFNSLFNFDWIRLSTVEQEGIFCYADGLEHNAYPSAFLYYMYDFGFLGIALGPMLTAAIYNWLYKLCIKDDFLTSVYISTICVTCLSTNYPFGRGFVFIIILALLCNKFTKVKKNKKNIKNGSFCNNTDV